MTKDPSLRASRPAQSAALGLSRKNGRHALPHAVRSASEEAAMFGYTEAEKLRAS